MKTNIILKVLFLIPAVLFIDYLLLITIGCTSFLFGTGPAFYCGPYCIACKIIISLSIIFILYIVSPEIVQLFKKPKNATSTKEQKSS